MCVCVRVGAGGCNYVTTMLSCSLSVFFPSMQKNPVVLRKYCDVWFEMDVKPGLLGEPHPPLNPDLLSSWHFPRTSFVQLIYHMCLWVTHKGANVGSGKMLSTQRGVGCEQRCSGRGYMIEVEGERDLRCASEEQHTRLRVLILAFSLQRSGSLSYTHCKEREFFWFFQFWKWDLDIMWHKPFSETPSSETTQIPKFRAGDRLSIPRLLIFLCLTLSGGLTASTFTSWHYHMTEWFLGGEKLSVESQWKLTSMPVVFFFFCSLL